jgi:hypothetical protein
MCVLTHFVWSCKTEAISLHLDCKLSKLEMGYMKFVNSMLKGISVSVLIFRQVHTPPDLTSKHRALVPTKGFLNYVITVLMLDKLFKYQNTTLM